MKGLRKLLPMVLAALLLVMLLPVSADNTVSRYGRQKLGEMTGGADLQYVYDKLVVGCESAQAQITIDISGKNIDADKLETAYKLFYSDYPEYFWVEGGYGASMEEQGQVKTLKVSPEYAITGGALTAAKSAYNAKVSALTAGLSGSDYDKAKTLHDRLIDTVTYTSTANDQNAYGALVEGKAVCNGYARAYQHLLQKAGIEAWYVSGSSVNPATGTPVGHAWNLVKLDGGWYYTDVTWDDQGDDTYYAYFNITTSQLLEGHAIGEPYADLVPNATATAANYYVKEGRVFASYDRAKLAALLQKDNNKTQIYITGDTDAFASALSADLLDLAKALGATGGFQVSSNRSQLGRAMIVNLVVLEENHTHGVKTTVKQVDASCFANGTKTYYVCSCGQKFLDQGCTQQVTSNSQLVIPATSHTPSGWKNDAANHWKECTVCGSEIADTRAAHKDTDSDRACDTCNYAIPEPAIPEDTGGVSGNGGDTSSEQEDNTQIETGDVTDPTQGTTDIPDTKPTDKTDTPNQKQDESKPVVWVVIPCAVVAAGAVAAGIFMKKKKPENPEQDD